MLWKSRNISSISLCLCVCKFSCIAGETMWKTLSCTGTGPSPRYRHTCTLVRNGNPRTNEDVLIIFGGIGENMRCLNDLHIFDLGSMKWIDLGITSGDIPAPLFGHISFPVESGFSSACPNCCDALMIFGGRCVLRFPRINVFALKFP